MLMLDTAEYFEQRGELDKAVLLYQRAGKERRAVELCFSARLYETLASIASKLTATSDPALLARCGQYCSLCTLLTVWHLYPTVLQSSLPFTHTCTYLRLEL